MEGTSARQRLALLIERLGNEVPFIRAGEPWVWPEGDPVATNGDYYIRWLPND